MRALLVFDTCGQTGYVALVDADRPAVPLAERTIAARETQEQLLPAVADVLQRAGMSAAGLAGIAVVTGPGSFTGVRVGLAAAKGLAEAVGVRLVACSRLAVLAAAAGGDEVTAWLDAGRTDVYVGHYRLAAEGVAVCDGEEMLPRGAALLDVRGVVAVAEPALADAVPGVRVVPEEGMRRATVAVAAGLFCAGRFADAALLDANYLRVPDAELALRARQAGA